MKQILKENKKLSFKLKTFITLAVIAVVVSFLFSLKYSGNSKNIYADLQISEKTSWPECSSAPGFYKEPLIINLRTKDPNAQIYYSLDGSEPSLASIKYSGPFTIENRTGERNHLSAIPTSPRWVPPVDNVYKGTVLRAIAVDKKNTKSKELVRTFFIDEKEGKRYSLPVISICVNEKDFFGYNKGIYVPGRSYTDKDNYIKKEIPLDLPWWEYPSNYLLRGSDAERPAHLEFLEPDNRLGFESNVGIRIHGNATRGFAQKSLRICLREKYGQAILNYNLFPSNPLKKFNSFILRNSGNDWNKTMFRDAFMQSLMKNARLDIQDYRPSIVFINGEYWGIHNIRERFDENYLANKYGLNKDSLTILELSGEIVHGEKSIKNQFAKLLDFVKENDISKEENYNYVKSKIDLESFSDFVIANVYFCNSDWPNNNVRFWRHNSDAIIDYDSVFSKDGKWRWMLYDTDWGFGYNSLSDPGADLLTKATKIGSTGVLFSALLKNKEFAKFFLHRFQFHLDTTFYSPSVVKKIDQMQSVLEPVIQEHINRWRAIGSYNIWLSNVNVLRQFAMARPQFQADQLNTFFNLKGNQQIVLKNGQNAY